MPVFSVLLPGRVIVWSVALTEPAGSKVTADWVVLPSARAKESVLFSERTVTLPFVTPPPLPPTTMRPSGISASALESVTATPTAPATCTFELAPGPWPDADVAPGRLLVLAPELALPARLPANDDWPLTWSLTPPLLDDGELGLPPATLACAAASLAAELCAVNATAPPAVRFRWVVASTSSVATVSASEMPTPVSPDLVSPDALVMAPPSCAAETVTEPVVVSVAPVVDLTSAWVSLSATEIAITGVMAVLPAAPPSAAVVMSLRLAAEITTLRALFSTTFWPMNALVSVSPMFSAIDAPMPNLPKPDCDALAETSLATKFSADSEASLPADKVTLALSATLAVESDSPMLRASDPAMPVSTPLTPEVALAPKLEVWSLLPRVGTSAFTTSPSASAIVALPTRAMLCTLATLTPTAMPTPVPVGTLPRLWPVPVAPADRLTRPVPPPACACALVSYSEILPLVTRAK